MLPDQKRLAGVRTPYAAMPDQLLGWVDDELGAPVCRVIARTGGMSPAVAATVVTETGARAFVKAVSADINPDTPTHFRHEVAVLSAIGPAPYRSHLLGSYDDGRWVALLLEDVDGDHPNWNDPEDVKAVFDAVLVQARELTPIPPDLQTDSVATDHAQAPDAAARRPARRVVLPAAGVGSVWLRRPDGPGERGGAGRWRHPLPLGRAARQPAGETGRPSGGHRGLGHVPPWPLVGRRLRPGRRVGGDRTVR